MRVPVPLAEGFGQEFEKQLAEFATQQGLLSSGEDLYSKRFLSRSVVPHLQKLSQSFNRLEEARTGLERYWGEGSNPKNRRLAYFLYFMPCNLFRVAAVWSELGRLGYRWPHGETCRGLELGAGPAAGTCGIAAGERFFSTGLPSHCNWALIEQDKPMLKLGAAWAEKYTEWLGSSWEMRPFPRVLRLEQGFLPPSAPKFHLFLSSYFLNELSESPAVMAEALQKCWDGHLEEEGLAILVEPALRSESRRLLELRRELLGLWERQGRTDFQILLPCLGHQACGALAEEQDWCHEEVLWWRPKYLKMLDEMTGLDRRSLPFSYLVIARSKRPRAEILPGLSSASPEQRYRLVSPSHEEGRDLEFFLCGQQGKRRARYRPTDEETAALKGRDDKVLERGDIVEEVELRGDTASTRIDRLKRVT